MQQSKKYLLLILLIAVLVAPSVALASWWNPFSWNVWDNIFHKQPTATQQINTAKWKTYTNTQYGFSIQCPTDWYGDETIAGIDLYSFNNNNTTYSSGAQPKGQVAINIANEENSNRLPLTKLCEQLISSSLDTDTSIISETNSKTQQYDMIIIKYRSKSAPDVLNGEVACASNGSKNVAIIDSPLDATKQNILDKILSTFKFTSTATTTEQSCLNFGGTVQAINCYCSGSTDFQNNCAIGGCACPPNPAYKKTVKSCDCGQGKCFDGAKCVNISH